MQTDIQKVTLSGNRKILNPILTVSGLLTMVSGIFIFCHVYSYALIVLHELMGLVFVITGVWHTALNWRALLKTLGTKKQRIIILAVIIVCVAAMAVSVILFPLPFYGMPQ